MSRARSASYMQQLKVVQLWYVSMPPPPPAPPVPGVQGVPSIGIAVPPTSGCSQFSPNLVHADSPWYG